MRLLVGLILAYAYSERGRTQQGKLMARGPFITEDEAKRIKQAWLAGVPVMLIAERFRRHRRSIEAIASRQAWPIHAACKSRLRIKRLDRLT